MNVKAPFSRKFDEDGHCEEMVSKSIKRNY